MDYSVLVVDDQPENIRLITLLLKEMDIGSKIYSAPNGKIALELIKKFVPDLVLADWEMPEMNGLELVKAVKQTERIKDTPIIMITAVKTDSESMKESFDAGVHDYLKKPFDKLEFVARVRATLKLHSAYVAIKKSKDKIAKQAKTINKQHKELEELNRLKDRILSIVSHDMRSPLGNLETLLFIFEDTSEVISEEEMSKYTGLLQKELNKVQALLDNLLIWAKYQITNVKIGKENVLLHDIVNELYSLFESKAANKNIELVNAIDTSSKLKNDENIIKFILRNLIYNAIKFTPEKGQIKVVNKINNGMYSISVIDSGVGMDKNQQKTLFSNDTISWKKGTSGELGTGLGLILCRELTEELNGEIKVTSEIGKGTTITFQFPV